MAQYVKLLEKSLENERAAQALCLESTRCLNAAVSRLYYAVFQIVYYCMLSENCIEENSRGKHELATKYIKERNRTLSREYQRLLGLRVDADYKIVSIEKNDFFRKKSYWESRMKEFRDNIRNTGRMIV